jgi:hypothetical protein
MQLPQPSKLSVYVAKLKLRTDPVNQTAGLLGPIDLMVIQGHDFLLAAGILKGCLEDYRRDTVTIRPKMRP